MPWVYVDDVVKATILAFEKNKNSCEEYIIVSSKEPTFNELVYYLKESLRVEAFIIHFPKYLFNMSGLIFEKFGNLFNFAPLINSVRTKSMTENRIYNTKKVEKLGFKGDDNFKSKINITVGWYIKNGYL